MNEIATYVPVSTHMLEDSPDIFGHIAHAFMRYETMAFFGESWWGPKQELERIEGTYHDWDPDYADDDCDC